MLVKYIETPVSALGESPWLADGGKENGGVGAFIAWMLNLLWPLSIGVLLCSRYGVAEGLLTALTVGLCFNIKWRAFDGPLAPVGSIIAGALSGLVYWHLVMGTDGGTLLLLAAIVGWAAAGFANVRFSYWFWGNPTVGEGTGAFFAFCMGPVYFLLWAAFFMVMLVMEALVTLFEWAFRRRTVKS